MVNSTHKMVNLEEYRTAAKACFTAYTEDLGQYKVMTANLHILIAHGAEYIK